MSTTTRVGAAGLAIIAVIGLALAWPGDRTEAGGGPPRWYQAAVDTRVSIGGELTPAVQFVIDTPGRVTGLYAAIAEQGRYGPDDWAVGSMWVNGPGGQALDDVFAVDSPLSPWVLHSLTTFGMPQTQDVWVTRGDVVTVLWDDDGSTPPDWPPATWVLEVQE